MQLDAPAAAGPQCGADVAAFPNYVIPLASPCPTISFVHDLALLRMPELFTLRKRLVMRPLLRHSVAAASAVATVSEASRRDIVDLLGVAPERITVLPGAAHPSCGRVGPDEVAAVRARHGLGRRYVLTVGTLEPRKNLLTLLTAFDQIGAAGGIANGAGADIDLVVVGGRGWRDEACCASWAPGGRWATCAGWATSPSAIWWRSTPAPRCSSTPRASRASAFRCSRPWPAARRSSPPTCPRCARWPATPPASSRPATHAALASAMTRLLTDPAAAQASARQGPRCAPRASPGPAPPSCCGTWRARPAPAGCDRVPHP